MSEKIVQISSVGSDRLAALTDQGNVYCIAVTGCAHTWEKLPGLPCTVPSINFRTNAEDPRGFTR